jgi:HD superfamily phosphohydrolase
MDVMNKPRIIFDPIYGFIHLNECEWEIVHSPFYQRLRWIRQLGFSSYVFHGAEHSRYGHSIGVMNNAHHILVSCDRALPNNDLFDSNNKSKEALFHKSVRLGALMHDLGTFPFSHTTEMAYVRFGETVQGQKGSDRRDDHEHLGSFIIKNTDFDGGITSILKKYGFDPQIISDLVKGIDSNFLANQILHSEIDCDRMDYLLRDAHYTGLKYGSYDRDYLLHHFKVMNVGGHDVLTIKDNALHCVEDFLNSRFAWYSQVVRSSRGAKYDSLAEELTFYFLEKGLIWKYSDLLESISKDPLKFYKFNDMYFMDIVHTSFYSGALDKNKKMKDIARSLLLEISPRSVKCEEFKQRLLDQDDKTTNDKTFKKAWDKVKEIEDFIAKNGSDKDWIVSDVPEKHIVFVKSHKGIVKGTSSANLLLKRDPVKISYDNGEVKLLAEVENSTISKLQNTFNFVPNVYASPSAYDLLRSHSIC